MSDAEWARKTVESMPGHSDSAHRQVARWRLVREMLTVAAAGEPPRDEHLRQAAALPGEQDLVNLLIEVRDFVATAFSCYPAPLSPLGHQHAAGLLAAIRSTPPLVPAPADAAAAHARRFGPELFASIADKNVSLADTSFPGSPSGLLGQTPHGLVYLREALVLLAAAAGKLDGVLGASGSFASACEQAYRDKKAGMAEYAIYRDGL